MGEPITVYVAELPDRYLLINAETGELAPDTNNDGWSYANAAKEAAEMAGWEVIDAPHR